MKLSQFYDHVVKLGSDRDPRSEKSKITSYGDTAILHGNPDIQVRKIMVGIDIEVAELLLADRIRQRQGLDLVVSHHPEGKAYARLHEVMQIQVDVLQKIGLDRVIAQKMLDERKTEVSRRILAQNHTRPVDAARILDLPFMCMHTPADNHAFSFIKSLMEKESPKTVQDIIEILKRIPEYKEASKHSVGPRIIVGNPKRSVGKILVEMTGGTEGPKDIFDKLYKVGVRTLISMHLSEEHFKRVLDANLNVVIAGHISSDNLGINLLLDRIEKEAKQKLQITSCSGFNRITRN